MLGRRRMTGRTCTGGREMDERDHWIERRELIKKAVVAGGIVWASPVIQSMTTAASAGTPNPSTCKPGQDSCDGPEFGCNGVRRCFCTGTAEGLTICACFDRGGCEGYQLCSSSDECPPSEFCTTLGTPDCCEGICVPLCSAT